MKLNCDCSRNVSVLKFPLCTDPPSLIPANEVCEGYVFTGVCLSTGGGGHMRGCWRACVVAGGHAWLPGDVHGCLGHAWLLGCVCGCQGACMAKRGACIVKGGMHGKGVCMVKGVCDEGGRAWDTTRYGDTINERTVRILLECILVFLKD